MVGARWSGSASLLVCVSVLVAACGASESASPGKPAVGPDDRTSSVAPAAVPDGSTAREVTYRCASGRVATVVVDVLDPADLAGVLNRIEPCEYDGGFRSGEVSVPCASGPLVVELVGREGVVVQPPPDSLCP